jgi:hypothetical protein
MGFKGLKQRLPQDTVKGCNYNLLTSCIQGNQMHQEHQKRHVSMETEYVSCGVSAPLEGHISNILMDPLPCSPSADMVVWYHIGIM